MRNAHDVMGNMTSSDEQVQFVADALEQLTEIDALAAIKKWIENGPEYLAGEVAIMAEEMEEQRDD